QEAIGLAPCQGGEGPAIGVFQELPLPSPQRLFHPEDHTEELEDVALVPGTIGLDAPGALGGLRVGRHERTVRRRSGRERAEVRWKASTKPGLPASRFAL